MVTKVRQYQRQVEAQRAQLDFSTKRCSQLEEENKRLRESLEVQGKMDEDPLVRQQLEALLAEKARLARENAQLQRENEHLFELLAYSTQGNRSPSASAGVGGFEVEGEAAGGFQEEEETTARGEAGAPGCLLEDGETSSRGAGDRASGNLGSEIESSSSAGSGEVGVSRSADLSQKRQATEFSGAAAVRAGESSTLKLETEPSEHAHESGHS
jgi:regulator of replication initiation timing